ncbi:DUF6934 family protein [Chitinophaga rhizophila]|uniref:Uncharacterized protein n=1 Tax=Chitinophaga rhizophila TaxID=2866212 RepID=A0ABS7GGB3_9BACT|nr:hypothetical protein [Chitinophaga rhizophila]MBW8685528.1 hypothetical protein [Chitinophaga rhizophila]
MNRADDVYDVREWANPGEQGLYYFFVSEGKREIIKVVQYEYVRQFRNRPLFNLGFGDYDYENDRVTDNETSDNNDHYRVFNTVLQTIPRLFEQFKDGVIVVRGSDSSPSFITKCRNTCKRRCDDSKCKKAHRRIGIYSTFLNKHFEQLNLEYSFYGLDGLEDCSATEPYEKGKNYRGVIIEKRLN